MSFIKLGANRKQIVICPKCLNRIAFNEETKDRLMSPTWKPDPNSKMVDGGCPWDYTSEQPNGSLITVPCRYVFPIRYLENSQTAPPFFVQVFGWSGHGKTVFLDALRLMLLDMRTFWPNYVHQSLTEKDMEYERTLRRFHLHGYMPDATQKQSRSANEVYIMQLDQMVRWGSRSLVIMDHAGEMFERFDVPVDEIPFLHDTPTVFMLVSLPQILRSRQGHSIDQLMNIYIEAMLKLQQRERRQRGQARTNSKLQRKLVIVLTMADIIEHLPMNLRNYVAQDDTWSRLRAPNTFPMTDADMAAYIERMGWVSDEIREWLLRDTVGAPGGANLVGLIESNHYEARYTLISATGHDDLRQGRKADTDISQGGIQITPRRVLDPFYWALEFQSS